MKRLIYALIAVFPLLVTSCLMEEKEVFDQTPAERMDTFLSEYKGLLESSENGWLFECYPEANQSYGGYAYVLKFKDGMVTAYFELADEAVPSTYKMTSDDGPVISFDTYNENLHFFAEPSADQYQGLQGDYEYNILGKSDDETEIYIKGRKSGNKMTFRKFSSADPMEYFNACYETIGAMKAPRYILMSNGKESLSCSISSNIFRATLAVSDATDTAPAVTESVESAYCLTDKGIRFYSPVTIAGVDYTELTYSSESDALVSADGKIQIVKGSLTMADILGTYKYTAVSLLGNGVVSGTLVIEESDNPAKGNVMFTTIFDTKCQSNIYATFDIENGILSVPSLQFYYVGSYIYAFVSAPTGSPSPNPTTFTVEPGLISGQSGWFGDGAFQSNGSFAGFFEAFDSFKATRVSQ